MNIIDIMLFFFGLWAMYAFFNRQRVVFRAEHIPNLNRHASITIKVEEEPGQVYLWNQDSEEFLAQGKDFDEAINRCIERFPGTKFKVLRENNEAS